MTHEKYKKIALEEMELRTRVYLDDIESIPIGLQDGVWLCGGAVRSIFDGKHHDSDYDYYFKDAALMDNAIEALKLEKAEHVRTTDTNHNRS